MSCAPSVSFKAVGRFFAEKELLALKIQGKDGDLDDEDFEGNFNLSWNPYSLARNFVEKPFQKVPYEGYNCQVIRPEKTLTVLLGKRTSSIGGTELTPFLRRILIRVRRNTLTPMTS